MPEQRFMMVSIAAILCAGTVMAVIAMSTQQWIVQELHGRITYGLTHECYEKPFDDGVVECDAYDSAPPEWSATFVFLLLGTGSLIGASFYAVLSFTDRDKLNESKKYGIAASVVFSVAALIFPGGFDYHGIGGTPYRLPDNAEIGYSYIMFVVTLVFVFMSQLMTMKVLFEDFLP
mmetsp:Transcript_8546/g.22001  ORF Transcript_8546/g.22001 Transcript_8546/m.22001 type:complete len:176 (+) Transcript_8546:55-582(+)|eukprot:CAMPEP_0182925178 /NCGR_PEP_ID=MMETSP0105_2-20130417/8392_1 /TAXON_ID=81532 ORGANISM="Acanthoeca-like sp., Strain 10tr" /NCGR_SAMPLE_ID=MMETSP0105_2 /ASSEMBLY_ACC=CAM_ASM_000205 /LENGTH=175 /DNA_ID=CAMNT_0025063011 /DNA_START=62 /DNA_END=589 /DNA_ORIENTATION=+